MSQAVRSIDPRGPLDAIVAVPGSKSETNRALVCASLATGDSELEGALESDDTVVMREAFAALGAEIDASGDPWRIRGTGGVLKVPRDPLYCQNSGTTARFLTAVATLAPQPLVVDGNARMRERPIKDLTTALTGLGAELSASNGCPPVHCQGGGLPGGGADIDARRSSQFVSAVLLAAPYAERDVTLSLIEGELVSRPYVDNTLDVMAAFGADASWDGDTTLRVRSGLPYRARGYRVEPDASSAAYPFCAAAIAGGRVRVNGIPADSRQPDFAILDLLERMGCRVVRDAEGVEVTGPSDGLRSLGEVDMNRLPDAALAYAVVALFADGPTLIKNVANLRIKETDRLAALETELRRLGARADAGPDSLQIRPGPLRGAEISTYDDHRMAMAFSLAGLRVPGVRISDPGCVSKTWPNFFQAFRHL